MVIATDNDTPRGRSFDGEKRRIYRTNLTSNKEDFHFQLTSHSLAEPVPDPCWR